MHISPQLLVGSDWFFLHTDRLGAIIHSGGKVENGPSLKGLHNYFQVTTWFCLITKSLTTTRGILKKRFSLQMCGWTPMIWIMCMLSSNMGIHSVEMKEEIRILSYKVGDRSRWRWRVKCRFGPKSLKMAKNGLHENWCFECFVALKKICNYNLFRF